MSNVTNTIKTVYTGSDRSGPAHKSVQRNLAKTQHEFKRFAQSLGVFAGGVGLARMTKSVVQASLKMQALESQFRAATGSIEMGAGEMEYARKVANDLGLQFDSTAGEYAKLIAASQGIGVTGKEVQDVFLGISMASRALFLDGEQVAGALRAIQQVMSKGTVQAEELRGQLGERIPGAFNLAADAMGMTTAQLNKMLQQGKVLATDLIPKLGLHLQKIYGPQASAASALAIADFNRLHNAMFEVKSIIGGAMLPGLASLASGMTQWLAPALATIIVAFKRAAGWAMQWSAHVVEAVETAKRAFGSETSDPIKDLELMLKQYEAKLNGFAARHQVKQFATGNWNDMVPSQEEIQKMFAEAEPEFMAGLRRLQERAAEHDPAMNVVENMRAAAEELKNTGFLEEYDKMMAGIEGVALALRQNENEGAADTFSASIQKTIDKLKTQIATFGMSEREIANYTYGINAAGEMGETTAAKIRDLTIDLIDLNEAANADKAKAKSSEFVKNLQRRVEVQTMLNNGLHRQVAIEKALEEYGGFDNEEIEKVKKMAGALYDLEQQQEKTNKRMQAIQDEAARSMFRAWEDFFFDPMSKGLSGLLKSFIDTIRKMIAQELAYRTISMLNFGGFFDGILGKRAKGGPVLQGGSYIVGEKGPELFTPSTSGMITPNHMMPGGGGGVVINNHIDARGATQELINVLPDILEQNNRVIEAQIFGRIQRGLMPG